MRRSVPCLQLARHSNRQSCWHDTSEVSRCPRLCKSADEGNMARQPSFASRWPDTSRYRPGAQSIPGILNRAGRNRTAAACDSRLLQIIFSGTIMSNVGNLFEPPRVGGHQTVIKVSEHDKSLDCSNASSICLLIVSPQQSFDLLRIVRPRCSEW